VGGECCVWKEGVPGGGGGGGGEPLHWRPWKLCSDSLRVWASLSIRTPIVPRGTSVWWGGRLVSRGLRKMDEGGLLYWGTLRYVKQDSEMGVYCHRGPIFGEHGWAFLSWGLLIRGIFIRSFRDMQMPCRWVSLSIGGPAVEPGVGSFAGTFERKEVYLGSFLGPRGH